MTTRPASIERVERIEVVMVHSQQRAGFAQRNLYAMDVDRNNKNCYACRGFGHLARHCRNRRMGMNRRMKCEENSNLNGDRGLMGPN